MPKKTRVFVVFDGKAIEVTPSHKSLLSAPSNGTLVRLEMERNHNEKEFFERVVELLLKQDSIAEASFARSREQKKPAPDVTWFHGDGMKWDASLIEQAVSRINRKPAAAPEPRIGDLGYLRRNAGKPNLAFMMSVGDMEKANTRHRTQEDVLDSLISIIRGEAPKKGEGEPADGSRIVPTMRYNCPICGTHSSVLRRTLDGIIECQHCGDSWNTSTDFWASVKNHNGGNTDPQLEVEGSPIRFVSEPKFGHVSPEVEASQKAFWNDLVNASRHDAVQSIGTNACGFVGTLGGDWEKEHLTTTLTTTGGMPISITAPDPEFKAGDKYNCPCCDKKLSVRLVVLRSTNAAAIKCIDCEHIWEEPKDFFHALRNREYEHTNERAAQRRGEEAVKQVMVPPRFKMGDAYSCPRCEQMLSVRLEFPVGGGEPHIRCRGCCHKWESEKEFFDEREVHEYTKSRQGLHPSISDKPPVTISKPQLPKPRVYGNYDMNPNGVVMPLPDTHGATLPDTHKGKWEPVVSEPEDDGKPHLKDSGSREEYGSGAHRDVMEGKGRYDLTALGWGRIMRRLAQHMERGYVKYGWKMVDGEKVPEPPYKNNWTRGIPLSRFLDSGLRHQNQWLMGEKDEPWHFIAFLWNMMCLGETWFRIQEGLLPEELNDLGDIKIVYDEDGE